MILEENRMELLVGLASQISYEAAASHIEAFEPYVIWTKDFLEYRARAYRAVEHPLAARAERELEVFRRNATQHLADMLPAQPEAVPTQ
jgi:hypothetical protein